MSCSQTVESAMDYRENCFEALVKLQTLTTGKEYVLLYDKDQDLYRVTCGSEDLYYEIGNAIEAINAFVGAATKEIKLRAMKKMLRRGQNPFTGEWCVTDEEKRVAREGFAIYERSADFDG